MYRYHIILYFYSTILCLYYFPFIQAESDEKQSDLSSLITLSMKSTPQIQQHYEAVITAIHTLLSNV